MLILVIMSLSMSPCLYWLNQVGQLHHSLAPRLIYLFQHDNQAFPCIVSFIYVFGVQLYCNMVVWQVIHGLYQTLQNARQHLEDQFILLPCANKKINTSTNLCTLYFLMKCMLSSVGEGCVMWAKCKVIEMWGWVKGHCHTCLPMSKITTLNI